MPMVVMVTGTEEVIIGNDLFGNGTLASTVKTKECRWQILVVFGFFFTDWSQYARV